MKVVINVDWGTFWLSEEAQKMINKIGCAHSWWKDENEYFGSDSEEERLEHLKSCHMVRENGKVLIDDHDNPSPDPKVRACPVLVQVVEKLREKANGRTAKLKVVEVPDDVEWIICEYDGWECVAEKHRVWD